MIADIGLAVMLAFCTMLAFAIFLCGVGITTEVMLMFYRRYWLPVIKRMGGKR